MDASVDTTNKEMQEIQDFDAVLDILEIDEELEEQFTEAVDEVSIRKLFNTLYKPKVWL